MRAVLALAWKDVRLLLSDKAGVFFAFCFPVLVAIFFGSIVSGSASGSRAMDVAIVDEDQTPGSQALVAKLQSAPELKVVLTTREDATDRVRHGKCAAYIVLPLGLGEAQERMFWGDAPTVELGMDPSRQAEAGMLQGVLTKYMAERMQDLFMNPARMRKNFDDARAALKENGADLPFDAGILQRLFDDLDRLMDEVPKGEWGGRGFQPVAVKRTDVAFQWEGPRSSFDVTFPQGIVWGMIACAATFGISLISERSSGTLVRLCMAPISRGQILAGKAVACVIATLFVAVCLLGVGVLAFGIRPHSALLLAMAVTCCVVAFAGIMMGLSVMGKTERSAGGIGWAAMVSMSMVGGGSIPLFFMPPWLKVVSHFSPVKWAILSLEGAMWRGFSLSEMLLPCGILLAVGAACFAIGVRAFRWMQA